MPGKCVMSTACNTTYRASQFYRQNITAIAFFRSQNSSKLPRSWNPPSERLVMNCHVSIRILNFGVPVTVKSSLTSGFFQKCASAHHSSFRMSAWGHLQWKMTPKTPINHKITRFELMCSEHATAKN